MVMKRYLRLILLAALMCISANIFAKNPLVVGIAEERAETKATAMRSYVDAISRAGNVPMIIADSKDPQKMAIALGKVDILLMIGGEDVAPAYYGEKPIPELGEVNAQRDTFEMALLKEAVKQHKPILGICRGLQIINVFFGGTLYQDLPSQYADHSVNHSSGSRIFKAVHGIKIAKDSRLYQVIQIDSIGVNSAHHQAVKDLAPGFRVAARCTDGVVEAIESDKYPVAAVQFHPERISVGDEPVFKKFFEEMITLSGADKPAKGVCNSKKR